VAKPVMQAPSTTTHTEGTTMNRGDFVAGMQVRLKSTGEIMTLGGTIDDWICIDADDPGAVPKHVQPGDVDPVASTANPPATARKPIR
jgi:hypothetical protein